MKVTIEGTSEEIKKLFTTTNDKQSTATILINGQKVVKTILERLDNPSRLAGVLNREQK